METIILAAIVGVALGATVGWLLGVRAARRQLGTGLFLSQAMCNALLDRHEPSYRKFRKNLQRITHRNP